MLERDVWRALGKTVHGQALIDALQELAPRLMDRPGVMVHRHGTRVVFTHGPVPAPTTAYALPPETDRLWGGGDPGPMGSFRVQLVPSRKAPVPAPALGAWWLRLAQVLQAAMTVGFVIDKETRNGVRVHRPGVPVLTWAEVNALWWMHRDEPERWREAIEHTARDVAQLHAGGAKRLAYVGTWTAHDDVVAVAAYDEEGAVVGMTSLPTAWVLMRMLRTHSLELDEEGVRIQRTGFRRRPPATPELFDPFRWTLP